MLHGYEEALYMTNTARDCQTLPKDTSSRSG